MPWGVDPYGSGAYGSVPEFGDIFQTTGIASAEIFGVGAKINFTISQIGGITSGEAFGVGASAKRTITQLTGIVSAETFGVGAKGNFIISQISGIVSAETFGVGNEVKVNYIPGWTLRAFSLSGVIVADINKYSNLRFQVPLSDKGSGAVDVAYDFAKQANLLGEELIWRVYYDGLVVFSFLTEALDETLVDESQVMMVTFAGPGCAEVLDWGTTLPPNYPSWTDRSWIWAGQKPLKAWLDLLGVVQSRGAVPMVTTSFSATNDSKGVPWVWDVDIVLEPGQSLFEHLNAFTALAGADWRMSPTFGLDVAVDLGTDKSQQIRFQVVGDQRMMKRGRNRKDLRNVAYAEGSDASIQEAYDAGSIAIWQRREVYAQAGNAATASTTSQVAQQIVEFGREERQQITVSVLPDVLKRKVFHDYNVGDWAGFDFADGSTANLRVVAISVALDSEGTVSDVELALQSLFDIQESRLQKLVSGGGSSFSAPASLQSGVSPSGAIEQVVSGAGPDPITGLSLSTGANENRTYIDVSWVTVPPEGADPVVEYEVAVARLGVGTVRAIRTASPPVRVEPVEPNVSYTISVRAISRFGRSSTLVSGSILAGTDATIPAQVQTLVMGAGLRTITLTWVENTEIDVVNGNGTYDVQIDTNAAFNTGNLQGKRTSGTVISYTIPTLAPTTYYGRVAAVDSSGNRGPWSATASVTTAQAVSTDITPLSIDAALIASAAITTLKVADGAITNLKVTDVSASKITAGSITAATITVGTGGVLRAGRTSAPYHYLLLDENGIRFYTNGSAPYTAGFLTVDLNVNGGTATFSGAITSGSTIAGAAITGSTITGGVIKTAASGKRVELNNTYLATVKLFSGQTGEYDGAQITADVWSGGLAYLYMLSPQITGYSSSSLQLGTGDLMTQMSCSSHFALWAGSGSQRLQIAAGGSDTQSWIRADAGLKLSSYTDTGAIAYIGWYDPNQIDFDAYEVRVNARFKSQGITDNGASGLYFWNIPGGSDVDAILRLAGSSQILQYTSTIKAKKAVVSLASQDDNPIWAMRPVSFKWKNRPQEELERIDRLRPGGRSVGFIAEEMHEVSPDCVTFNSEDEPIGINESGVIAYLVAGVQHLRSLVEDLQRQVKGE